MSISSVVQDFLNEGLECSIVNRFKTREIHDSQTFAFKLKEKIILVITDNSNEICAGKFLHYFKARPSLLSESETIQITGHPKGCLSPFGLKNPLKVYIDVSLKNNNYIYICAGIKNFVVNVTPEELTKLTNAEWIDIWKR
jgi:prolyl-tRNA editing enzyme YbaK/EbsC (Cys-tRNA(Pro) deacylase)